MKNLKTTLLVMVVSLGFVLFITHTMPKKINVTVTGVATLTEYEKVKMGSEDVSANGYVAVETITKDSAKTEAKAFIRKETLEKAKFPFSGILYDAHGPVKMVEAGMIK